MADLPRRSRAAIILTALLVGGVVAWETSVLLGIVSGLCLGAVAHLFALMRVGVVRRKLVLTDAAQTSSGDVVVVRLRGPLTFLSESRLEALIDGPPWPPHVLIDLADVPLVDAKGLGDLEQLAEFLAVRGTRAALVRASPPVAREIARAGTLARFAGATVYASTDEALDHLSKNTARESTCGRAVYAASVDLPS